MVRNRRPGIWGGISVLEMLVASIEELLEMRDWEWDFVLNLSESDYPVKSNEALAAYLGANRGRNFVKSHGREPSAFVKKQGLDRAFIECDGHMWRLGPREVQKGIQDVLKLAQGSDGGGAVLRFSWAAASLAAMGVIKRWMRWTSGWPDGCRGVSALLLLYV